MKTLGLRVGIQSVRLGAAQVTEGPRKAWHKNPDAPDRHRLRGRAGMERRRRWLFLHPLCVQCEEEGRVTAGTIADHVIPLSQGGADNESNFQTLCVPHHDAKSRLERGGSLSVEAQERRMPRLQRSAIPVTLVCGPPGSGKSTFIRERATVDDVVIDLDRIMQKLSGLAEHHTGVQWVGPALDERNRQLRALASDTKHTQAWFVISAPNPQERGHWAAMLGASVVLLDTPLEECIRRITLDRARHGHTERMIAAARGWWMMNYRGGV